MQNDDLPLSNITVLVVTLARAGPTAVRQLADWGAKVIRIEVPGSMGPQILSARHGPDFQNLHRNKKCMTLNLKEEKGREIFFKLVEKADIIIENFRAGVKDRLGIDYESAKAVNPRIIYGSISGFGQDGPYRDRPGVDQIAQGMGGLMSITGLEGQGPVRVGIPISDLCAGLFLANGILIALHERERSGQGQWVQTSLLEAQIAMLDLQAARWLVEGDIPGQAGNDHPTITPMGVFPTADGPINIAPTSNGKFRALCEIIGAEELLEKPEFADGVSRTKHRAQLNEAIAKCTIKRKGAEWIELFTEAGIPAGPINTIDQTFADEQVQHLGIAQPVDHPALGTIDLVGQPVHLTRTPTRLRTAAPEHSEHTEAILLELGYSPDHVDDFKEQGIV